MYSLCGSSRLTAFVPSASLQLRYGQSTCQGPTGGPSGSLSNNLMIGWQSQFETITIPVMVLALGGSKKTPNWPPPFLMPMMHPHTRLLRYLAHQKSASSLRKTGATCNWICVWVNCDSDSSIHGFGSWRVEKTPNWPPPLLMPVMHPHTRLLRYSAHQKSIWARRKTGATWHWICVSKISIKTPPNRQVWGWESRFSGLCVYLSSCNFFLRKYFLIIFYFSWRSCPGLSNARSPSF